MRVLVCGGRTFGVEPAGCDLETAAKALAEVIDLSRVLDFLHAHTPISCIIEGAAKGADTLAKGWAHKRSVPVEEYPANWKKYGRRAGYLRNQQMLAEGKPEIVVAFPGGRGTANMVELARKVLSNEDVIVLEPGPNGRLVVAAPKEPTNHGEE